MIDQLTIVLSRLLEEGGQLLARDGALHVHAPNHVLNHGEVQTLRDGKPKLLAMLAEGECWGPASVAQKAVWDQFERTPGAVNLNIAYAAELRSDVDPERLAAALSATVARHAQLRANLATFHGRVFTKVRPPRAVEFDVLQGDERSPEQMAAEFADAPFDLSRDLLLRAGLLVDGPRKFVLLVAHHAVTDLWSMDLLFETWDREYRGNAKEQQSASSDVAFSFFDHVREERSFLDSGDAHRQIEFWRKELTPLPATLSWVDFGAPRGDARTALFERCTFDDELSDKLVSFCREAHVTPFNVVLAGLQTILHRLCANPDLVVGTPRAGRDHEAFSSVVGDFVDALPLRSRYAARTTFLEHVRETQRTTAAALDHSQLPFAHVVQHTGAHRSGRAPLIQAMLTWHRSRTETRPSFEARVLEIPRQRGAPCDLMLTVVERKGRFEGLFTANAEVASAGLLQTLSSALVCLLSAALAQPDTSLCELPLYSGDVMAQFAELESGGPRCSSPGTIPEAFLQVVSARGDQVAVSDAATSWTYQELHDRAQAYARALASRGIGAGSAVGVQLDRTCETIAVMLGVLLAGAAYVPLDPSYPEQRSQLIAESAEFALLIAEGASEPSSTLTVSPERLLEAPADASPRAPCENDLAYVIYTSGSTGTPKGVEVQHGATMNVIQQVHDELQFSPGNRWLAVSSFSFDISVLELFLPLTHGGTVHLASGSEAKTPQGLAQATLRARPDVVQATPTAWRLLCMTETRLPGVAAIACGEPLTPDLAAELSARGARVFNGYGPTEATIFATTAVIEPNAGEITIGRPVPGLHALVLNDQLERVPLGARGELYLSGLGLARGYRNRPDLTAQRFITSPQWGRLYRTGDLVRWTRDGNLIYDGRADQQVKLRGHRIELEEIELLLRSQPTVSAAAVAVREVSGDRRLVAFLVADGDAIVPPDEALVEALAQQLPDYMVPKHFEWLEEMPSTPNAKLDRLALSQLELGAGTAGASTLQAGTGPEREVALIFARVLAKDVIGLDDNFFDLGGHSLLAVTVAAEIEKQLGVSVTGALLYEHPSPRSLSRYLFDDPHNRMASTSEG